MMPREDEPKAKDAPTASGSERAKRGGGNPDKPPSANAGNVGLGAADADEAPRKPE